MGHIHPVRMNNSYLRLVETVTPGWGYFMEQNGKHGTHYVSPCCSVWSPQTVYYWI